MKFWGCKWKLERRIGGCCILVFEIRLTNVVVWLPGETANSAQPPEQKCGGKVSGKMCFDETCSECNSVREANSQTVRGTLLVRLSRSFVLFMRKETWEYMLLISFSRYSQIPCRTAMRGSFPLNGTYFQVNEVRYNKTQTDRWNIFSILFWFFILLCHFLSCSYLQTTIPVSNPSMFLEIGYGISLGGLFTSEHQ